MYVLAGGGRGTEGGGLDGGSGLVGLVALLEEELDATVLGGLDTEGLQ